MNQKAYDLLAENPIIVAVRDDETYKKCMNIPESRVVFVLFGSISSIPDIVSELKGHDHQVFVHMDLISGLSSREDAVDFIRKYTNADGIISTRIEQIKRGKSLGLDTVYRIFVIDSKAFSVVRKNISNDVDIVEILPGLMPKIIRKMTEIQSKPVIAGGLISDREDVISALDAGAVAISTTNVNVWDM